jgi:hypothetical protein
MFEPFFRDSRLPQLAFERGSVKDRSGPVWPVRRVTFLALKYLEIQWTRKKPEVLRDVFMGDFSLTFGTARDGALT